MSLFGKKKQLPSLFSAHETPAINFNTVVEYLEGLSRYDYEKLLKVVSIYRNANKDANKILGIKDEPTTAIDKESRLEAELGEIPFIDPDVPIVKPKKKGGK